MHVHLGRSKLSVVSASGSLDPPGQAPRPAQVAQVAQGKKVAGGKSLARILPAALAAGILALVVRDVREQVRSRKHYTDGTPPLNLMATFDDGTEVGYDPLRDHHQDRDGFRYWLAVPRDPVVYGNCMLTGLIPRMTVIEFTMAGGKKVHVTRGD